MWLRKQPNEIEAISRAATRPRLSPLLPAVLGIIVGSIMLIWVPTVEAFLIVAALVFVVTYIYRVICGNRGLANFVGQLTTGPGSYFDDNAFICTSCFSAQDASHAVCVKCGAPIENIEYWRWVADKADSSFEGPPNHVPDPASPSVTPPAAAGGAPSVGADH
jgi:hypothetical protein